MPRLSDSLCDTINDQIGIEMSSAYYYLNLSTQCAARNLHGSAHWLKQQWTEELGHAMKLIDYVLERGNEVRLSSLDKPQYDFTSLTALFQAVLEHEQSVTASINALYQSATEEKDYAAQTFIQWYVTEQVEEENSAQDVVDTLRMVGDEGAALLMVDRQLGRRIGGEEAPAQ